MVPWAETGSGNIIFCGLHVKEHFSLWNFLIGEVLWWFIHILFSPQYLKEY